MRFRQTIAMSWVLCALALGASASAAASDPQGFVEDQHHRIEALLHTPASASRDVQVTQALSSFVDYDELTRRAFGEPCPAAEPSCEDLWAKYDDSRRAEVRGLLEQLVRKTYQRNLLKTLDYDVTYRGSRDAGTDVRVMTEA